jgi:AcrR family transcriptional regulator
MVAVNETPYGIVWSMATEREAARTTRSASPRPDPLGPDDWTKAALNAIAERGAQHVSIERLARELGATKGSFYWHFKDRPALISAALKRWELEYTDRVIERLLIIDDPRLRFRALLEYAFDDQPGVRIDTNLLADAGDPVVTAALDRVARKRLSFIRTIFTDIGSPGASDRALLAYSAYIGLAQLRRTAPALTPRHRRIKTYIDSAMACLLGDGLTVPASDLTVFPTPT